MLKYSVTTWNATKRSPLWENRLLMLTHPNSSNTLETPDLESAINIEPTILEEIKEIRTETLNALVTLLNSAVNAIPTADAANVSIAKEIGADAKDAISTIITTNNLKNPDDTAIEAQQIEQFLKGEQSGFENKQHVQIDYQQTVPESLQKMTDEGRREISAVLQTSKQSVAAFVQAALSADLEDQAITKIRDVRNTTGASINRILTLEEPRNLGAAYNVTEFNSALEVPSVVVGGTDRPLTEEQQLEAEEQTLLAGTDTMFNADNQSSYVKLLRDADANLETAINRIEMQQAILKDASVDKALLSKQYLDDVNDVNVMLKNAQHLQSFVRLHRDWISGRISPTEFVKSYEEAAKRVDSSAQAEFEAIIPKFKKSFISSINSRETEFGISPTNPASLDSWDNATNFSSKLAVAYEVYPALNDITEKIVALSEEMKGNTKKLNNENNLAVNTIRQNRLADPKYMGAIGGKRLGDYFEWYSILHMINGFKKAKTAFLAAFEAQSDQKGAKIAAKLGGAISLLPFQFAKNIGDQLNIENNERNSQASEKIKGLYEFNQEGFATVKKDLSKAISSKDGIKTIGIIKYASSRGWLYQIEEISPDPNSRLLGYKISDLFGTTDSTGLAKTLDYFRTENIKGSQAEREKAFERVVRSNDADAFVRELRKQLDAKNLPAVMGVMKAAVKEGKRGTISLEMVTNILRKLREDPELRALVSQEWVTAAGKDGEQYKFAYGIGLFKEDDKTFFQWLSMPDADMNKGNLIVKMTGAVEKRILKLNPALEKDTNELDMLVAKVMAGAVVKINDSAGKEHHVSIFEKQFEVMRNSVPMKEYDPPNPFDDDYGYISEESGQLLRGTSAIDALLKYDTSGKFVKADYATGFIAKAHKRLVEMEAAVTANKMEPNTLNTYKAEVNKLFDEWLLANLNADNRMGLVNTRDETDPSKFLLANMVDKGLISRDAMIELMIRYDNKVVDQLNGQLKDRIKPEEIAAFKIRTRIIAR